PVTATLPSFPTRRSSDLHVLVRPTSSGTLHNLAHLRECVRVHRGDVTDKQSVLQILKRFAAAAQREPIIFHLAAQSHVGESWNRDRKSTRLNSSHVSISY